MRLLALDVDDLSLLEPATGLLVLQGRAHLAGETIDLTASVPDFQDGLKAQKIGFSMSAQSRVASLRATGHVDFAEPEIVLDGSLSAQAADLSQVPTGITGFTAPGSLAAQARFEGTAEQLEVSDILVQWQGPEQSSLTIQGSINDLDDLAGVVLDVSGRLAETAWLASVLPDTVGTLKQANVSCRIEGDSQALRLEQIKLYVGDKNTLWLRAAGQIHFRDWDQSDPLQTINLDLQANSRNTKTLAKLLGTEFPELGAVNAKARLQTVSNRHQITEFQLQTAKGAPVSVSLSGMADHVVLLPEPAVEGMALNASASTADVTRLNALFGWQAAIPAIGPAQASARISGSDHRLSVSDISLTAGSPDLLLIKASGHLGVLSLGNAWRPQGADLNVKAGATGSKALADLLGYHVPELGPLAASAKLRDEGRTLELQSGRIRVGDAWSPAVHAEGYVRDLFGAARTRWDVALDLNGHQFAQFAQSKQIPELGALSGKLQISNSDGSLGIDTLSLNSRGSELLSMALTGQYGDFDRLSSLSLNGLVNARDLEIVGALLGRDWPPIGPFRIETRLSRVVNNLVFDTIITAGKAETHADLVATIEAEPLLVSGKIVARNAFAPFLVKRTTQGVAKKPASTGPVFSRERLPFDWMHKFDLDLVVDVESFDPELSRAQSGHANIAMSSGQLWVRPVTINYPVGQLILDLHLDARERPRLGVKAFGEHLDPWHALYLEEGQKHLKGNLDIDIDLALSGNSAHELANSAQGGVYVQLQNGAIRSDLVDLLFADLVGWVRTKASREKYDHYSCGVADFSIAQGVATTKAFILDGDQITISGEGSIDLGQEQLDYVFLPRKKSRFIAKAEPVKITGSLSDPKVTAIPWKSAAATYGTLWFAPYVFVGVTAVDYLAGQLRGKGKESPCVEYYETFARPAHHLTAE